MNDAKNGTIVLKSETIGLRSPLGRKLQLRQADRENKKPRQALRLAGFGGFG